MSFVTMINVKRAAALSLPLKCRFWLLNALLLLLYIWTLTETTEISVTIEPNTCIAHTPERNLTVACSQLYRGYVGIYSSPDPIPDFLDSGPLDWIAPTSAWDEIEVVYDGSRQGWRDTFSGSLQSWQAIRGAWRTRAGELRPPSGDGLIIRQETLPNESSSTFQVLARLQRPYDNAGLLLLQPDGRNGWAFIVTPFERRGTWWRWQDDQLGEPIAGIPFQKPALAQFQSLLRRVLIAHQSALLVMGVAWLISAAARRLDVAAGTLQSSAGNSRLFSRQRRLLLLLTLLTFGLSLHIAVDILERIPHVQDSVTYLFQAKTLARGHLSVPAPPLPDAFEQEFLLVRDGRWFGKYPPGYPAILAIGVLAGAPWAINPLLAALSVPLLFVLSRRLYPSSSGTALLSTALPLVSPFFLFMSGSHMAHPAELFWMLLCMVLWLRVLHPPHPPGAAFGAGVALGMLSLTRQLSAVAGAIPFLAVTFIWFWVRQSPVKRPALLSPAISAGLSALPFLAFLFAHQWALTGDPLQDPRLLFWEYDHLGFGHDIGEGQNAFQLVMTPEGLAQVWYYDPSQPPRGHSIARGLYNIQQNWLAFERDLFGWLPALTFSFIWLVVLLQPRKVQNWMLLVPFLCLLGAYMSYWADGISYGPRYFYVALPALFLLTARGAMLLSQLLGGRSGKIAVAMLLFVLVAVTYIVSAPEYVETYHDYNFVSRDSLQLIEEQAKTPTLILVEPGIDWWHYGATFSANSPWLDGPIVVARDLDPRSNQRLIEQFPDRHVYRLSGSVLQSLGES